MVQHCGDLDPGVGGEEGLDLMLDLRVHKEGSGVEILEAVDGSRRTVAHGLDARQGAEDEGVDLVAKLEREREEGGSRSRTYRWRLRLHCADSPVPISSSDGCFQWIRD